MKRADLVEEDETAHLARGGGWEEAMMLRDWYVSVHWRVLALLLLLHVSVLGEWRRPCPFH